MRTTKVTLTDTAPSLLLLYYYIINTILDDSHQMSLGPADLVSPTERQVCSIIVPIIIYTDSALLTVQHRDLQMLMLKQFQLKQFQAAHTVPAWAAQAQLVSRFDWR